MQNGYWYFDEYENDWVYVPFVDELSKWGNKMYRFEKTDFGWNLYVKRSYAFVYFGHFYTQKEAKRIYKEYQAAQVGAWNSKYSQLTIG